MTAKSSLCVAIAALALLSCMAGLSGCAMPISSTSCAEALARFDESMMSRDYAGAQRPVSVPLFQGVCTAAGGAAILYVFARFAGAFAFTVAAFFVGIVIAVANARNSPPLLFMVWRSEAGSLADGLSAFAVFPQAILVWRLFARDRF
jgi:type IV secretory pathway TrbD component